MLLCSCPHLWQTYADTPPVTSAVLKAISELVLNKAQRIVFGPSSASGILLFREASQLLSSYGNRILGYMPVGCRESYVVDPALYLPNLRTYLLIPCIYRRAASTK